MATLPLETVSGVVTSWLPLTTGTSTPPSDCYSAIYSQQADTGQLVAFDPFYQSIVPSFTTACFPFEASLWYNQGTNTAGTATSLGPFECPGGYSTAFTTEESTSTQIACCPSGYAYQGSMLEYGTIGECWSTPEVGSTMRYFTSTDSSDSWFETSTVLGTTHVVGIQINGWNIASETKPSSSSSTSSSSSSTPSPSASPDTPSAQPGASSNLAASSPTSPPISNSGTSPSTGLSSGSKAALGVGIALAVVGIVALGLAFFLYKHPRQQRNTTPFAPIEDRGFWAIQDHPKEVDSTPRGTELTAQTGPYYELGENYRGAEP